MLRHTLLASASLFMLGLAAPALAAPEVDTASGPVAGATQSGVDSFLGIRYAAPPVGELRWKAPQPVEGWDEPVDATSFGNDCAQEPFPSDAAPLGSTPSEDCLYVNVWRPEGTEANADLPVMVWIHGGGFLNGGASAPVYDGAALADQGMVVVSLNYRLGRFGFFAHPAILAEGDDTAGGNFGYLDQVAALRWVNENIAEFGGDPEHVTLVGESAGGRSVHVMSTSPMTRGLVQAAVIQSGGDGSAMVASMEAAEQAALTFAEEKGIEGETEDAAAELRALSAEDIINDLNLATLFSPRADQANDYAMPVEDGAVAIDTRAAYASGDFADFPVMIGATSADLGGLDGMMLKGATDYAALMNENGMHAWDYVFDYVGESVRSDDMPGAAHASELPFFLGTVEERFGDDATALDETASDTALGYLASFVKTFDPNHAGATEWPEFTSRDDTLYFRNDGTAGLGKD